MTANLGRNPLFAAIAAQADDTPRVRSNGEAPDASLTVRRPLKPTARASTKLIAGHFDPEVSRQLRHIAVEEDTTVQTLLGEAIDLLFVKKGKAKIAELMQRSPE